MSEKKAEENQKIPFKMKALGFVIAQFLRFLFYSSKKTYIGKENVTQYFDKDQPIIVVSWHNRNILGAFGYLSLRPKGRQWFPMSSASKDGSIATSAMEWLGVTCIRGSSSKRGMQALREMLRTAKDGNDLGITPDGPRGPKYKIQEGVITTAKLTGCPLVPMAYQAKRKKLLNSWDAMIVPFPFNHLRYVYGEPMVIPRKATEEELETYRLKLEEEMMRICAVSDQF